MDNFKLIPVKEQDKQRFIIDIQEAFQLGFEEKYGSCDEKILPTEDIEESFAADGSEAYFAVVGDEIVGGAVIVINSKTGRNHLDLLYVKVGCQNKGIGKAIWGAIEALHPETKVWETYTPYFERRNIHFYVNQLGFQIVEFYNQKHKESNQRSNDVRGMPFEECSDFFRFEKAMKQKEMSFSQKTFMSDCTSRENNTNGVMRK